LLLGKEKDIEKITAGGGGPLGPNSDTALNKNINKNHK